MSDVPSVPKRIQEEETEFEAPVSESTARKLGGTMNFLLDNYAIPPGASMLFSGLESAIPIGWFPEDGREISRTTYANLFAAIGTLAGEGDGITTFNVPDSRGTFPRMVDATTQGQKGYDPQHASRTPTGTGTSEDPNSYQADQFLSHSHRYSGTGGAGGVTAGFVVGDSFSDYAFDTNNRGGAETRPKSMYKFFIIKT